MRTDGGIALLGKEGDKWSKRFGRVPCAVNNQYGGLVVHIGKRKVREGNDQAEGGNSVLIDV